MNLLISNFVDFSCVLLRPRVYVFNGKLVMLKASYVEDDHHQSVKGDGELHHPPEHNMICLEEKLKCFSTPACLFLVRLSKSQVQRDDDLDTLILDSDSGRFL